MSKLVVSELLDKAEAAVTFLRGLGYVDSDGVTGELDRAVRKGRRVLAKVRSRQIQLARAAEALKLKPHKPKNGLIDWR